MSAGLGGRVGVDACQRGLGALHAAVAAAASK